MGKEFSVGLSAVSLSLSGAVSAALPSSVPVHVSFSLSHSDLRPPGRVSRPVVLSLPKAATL